MFDVNNRRCWRAALLVLVIVTAGSALTAAPAWAQDGNRPARLDLPSGLGGVGGPEQWTSPEGLTSALQVLLLLTVISLAPRCC